MRRSGHVSSFRLDERQNLDGYAPVLDALIAFRLDIGSVSGRTVVHFKNNVGSPTKQSNATLYVKLSA